MEPHETVPDHCKFLTLFIELNFLEPRLFLTERAKSDTVEDTKFEDLVFFF